VTERRIPIACLAAWVTSLSAGGAASQQGALEEIVVTATRRETALQSTPVSVGVLSGSDLDSIGARDIVDYFELIPGLNYTEDAFGGYRIMIRGIAAGTFVETRPLAAFYLDETPMMMVTSGSAASPQWGGARPQAIDIERVEVLRGPQGMLFGAASLGGTVRMITNAPDVTRLYGSVDASYSDTAHGGENGALSAVLNAPLTDDRLALRAVGYWRDDAGYIDNVSNGRADVNDVSTRGARFSLLWNAAEDLTFTFRAAGQQRKTGGMAAADIGFGEYQQWRYVLERDDEKWELYTLDVAYELPRVELELTTSRLRREPELDSDATRFIDAISPWLHPTTNAFDDHVVDLVHELRISSTADTKLSWLGGLYYQDESRGWTQDHLSPGFDALTGGLAANAGYPDVLWHGFTSGTLRQQAVYGELSYQLNRAWQMTVGARWFDFDYTIHNTTAGLLPGPSSLSAAASESGLTPKVGFAYAPNDEKLLFLNVAEGFRPGGINEYTDQMVLNCTPTLLSLGIAVPPQRPFKSDSLWNLELGGKATWLDGRLASNATLFHIRWQDMQTPRTLPCGMNIIENVGKATSDGFEIEVAWQLLEQLEISLGVARTDAHLAQDAPTIGGEDGEHLPTVPEWTYGLSVDSEFSLPGRAEGFARADYRYVGGSWSAFVESERRWAASRRTLDLRVGARLGDWQVEGFADNIGDERGVLVFNGNIVGTWQSLLPPRTVGVRVRASF
jgi:outer membrane receptor protein involved in Fe transport